MTKPRLIIVGAGGFGREMLAWLKQTPAWSEWTFAGFLDDNPEALAAFDVQPGIIGKIEGFPIEKNDQFVCAIGNPRARLRLCRHLRDGGGQFPVVRHPSAVVGDRCRIGMGCIICPGAVLTSDIVLGDFVIVNVHSSIGHDARIGDGVTLSPHVDITGFVQVGEGAFLGSHASVLPSAKVGAYARVGAGSVVLRSAAAGATVMGVPARQILP